MSSLAPTETPMPVESNYAAIVSPQLVGSLLNFFFFGSLVIQVYTYRSSKDNAFVKFLVYFIFLVLLASTVLNAADVEYWFGSGYGNISHFSDPRNGRFYTPIMGSFVALIVQTFFVHRIFSLKRAAWPVSMFVLLGAMAQCAGGMGLGITSYLAKPKFDSMRNIFLYLWLVSGAAVDVVIAIAMSSMLIRETTRDWIKNVVRMFLETNAFAAVVALVGLFLYNTTYFTCPLLILPGIYANTLLVMLNNRREEPAAAPYQTSFTVRAEVPLRRDASAIMREKRNGGRWQGGVDASQPWRDGDDSASEYEQEGRGRLALTRRSLVYVHLTALFLDPTPGDRDTKQLPRQVFDRVVFS
ncbi:hypothetical protein HMN09_01289100 [Mycena chlorophos]|uniref:DUF6534 domain-containing protein n=1 Tax=Mycena chlorophos TaxID=658473 RepID=A0A8H6VSF7_MYCCL|nr:hypothetical protein HMN09_01289100 [Mycena chlorophos]